MTARTKENPMTDHTTAYRERRARYAAAMDAVTGGCCPADLIDAVLAVADAEQADLRTRVAQAEELLSIAHGTSNRSETERAAAQARVAELEQQVATTRAAAFREAADAIATQDPAEAPLVGYHAWGAAACLLRRMADEARPS